MMKHDNTPRSAELNRLESDVQKITSILLELAQNDGAWWKENIPSLISQPLNSLNHHLSILHDTTLTRFDFVEPRQPDVSILEPLEGLVWLAALCQLDRISIGALPKPFVEFYDLQWRILAMHWLH